MSTTPRALILDDEPDIRELLEITLGRMQIETWSAANLAEAHALLQEETFQLCLTDMQLPDGNGIDLVRHLNTHHPETPVAMITAFGSVEAAIDALKAGAFDFVQKPIDLEQLRQLVGSALQLHSDEPAPNAEAIPTARLIGDSQAMGRLRQQIQKLARSQAPIYISGESGSGKEVVARLIHDLGPRQKAPFIPVNCGAIPAELMESELFGHTKGSFTGATSDKEGLFQAANGGTLFLDEVADLPLNMQVKLLRAIQEKAIRPVGSQQELNIDVRILSATHQDLSDQVDQGRFRQDLYYRINVIELPIPPLRQRSGDVQLLTTHILQRMAQEYGTRPPTLSGAALLALEGYSFPGNVRELENILERAYTLCETDTIMPGDLQLTRHSDHTANGHEADDWSAAHDTDADMDTIVDASALGETTSDTRVKPEAGESLETYLEDVEKGVILEALEATRWNKTAAAKQLGITFRALRYRLKKLRLE